MARLPKLGLHASGNFFIKYNGKNHYLGRDKAEAQRQYIEHIRLWRAGQDSESLTASMRLVDLAELLEREVEAESGPPARRYLHNHLIRFLAAWGNVPAAAIKPPQVTPVAWIKALKADMLLMRYAPRTINHDLGAAKRLIEWAGSMGYIAHYPTRGIKGVPLGARQRHDVPLATFIAQVRRAELFDPRLGPWMRLHFLTACRPAELVRLVHRRGTWEHGGPMLEMITADGPLLRFHDASCLSGSVFRMANKVARRTQDDRYIPLTGEALLWLSRCTPAWSTSSGYAQAVAATQPDPPHHIHHIRHTAASHLHGEGAAVADIELALGHWPRGAWMNYVRTSWRTPLQIMRSLRLSQPETAWESSPQGRDALDLWQQQSQQQKQNLLARTQRGRIRRFPPPPQLPPPSSAD